MLMLKKNTSISFYASFVNVNQLAMIRKIQWTDILGIAHYHAISVPHVANNFTKSTIWRPISKPMIQKNSSIVLTQSAPGGISPKWNIIIM